MLNYRDLSKKFDDLLLSKTRDEIQSWLEFDEIREGLHRVREKIPYFCEPTVVVPKVSQNLQNHAGFVIFNLSPLHK